MTRIQRFGPTTVRRRLAPMAAALLLLPVMGGAVAAHGPDPFFSGGPFAQNQDLRFRWRAGSEPAAAIKTAILAAAADANASRGSRAATFTYDAGGTNPIGYGLGATCGVNGLACFTRTAPTGFTMWLREQGHVFDWGTLKWCQAYSQAPNGCYDAETIALDEFGHVEGLGHHVNAADDSDYMDAVVQTYSRTKPATGWNVHTFRRCDVAALQLAYGMVSTTAKYSTCLDLVTSLTLMGSPTVVRPGDTTTLVASLKVAGYAAYDEIGGNPVSGRSVTLQRRAPGTTRMDLDRDHAAGGHAGHLRPEPAGDLRDGVPGRLRGPDRGGPRGEHLRHRPPVPGQLPVRHHIRRQHQRPLSLTRKGAIDMSVWSSLRMIVAILAIAMAGSACASSTPSGSASPTTAGPSAALPTPTTTGTSSPPTPGPSTGGSPSPSLSAGPPDALLKAEGGDPVTGQLGSYTWADGGSDSPWLPGTPITVGAREPLTVTLGDGVAIADWTARRVPAGTTNGADAVGLGAGVAPATFTAPAAGRWSVQVTVRFGDDLGSATYYWGLTVR